MGVRGRAGLEDGRVSSLRFKVESTDIRAFAAVFQLDMRILGCNEDAFILRLHLLMGIKIYIFKHKLEICIDILYF